MIPTIINQFKTFGAAISLVSEGAGTFSEVLKIAGTNTTILSGAFASALPVIVGVSAAIAALIALSPKISKWWKEITGDIEYYDENLESLNSELETNKKKLEKLSQISYADRSSDIQNEIDKLQEVNNQLEQQIANQEKLKSQKLVENTREKFGTYDYEAYRIGSYYIKEFEDFEDAVRQAKEIVEEQNLTFKDAKGNLRDIEDVIVAVGETYVESTENIDRYIAALRNNNSQLLQGTKLTGDFGKECSDVVGVLEDYYNQMTQSGIATSDLSDYERQQLDIIESLLKKYYEYSGIMADIPSLLDKVITGVGLQKFEMQSLTQAIPELNLALDDSVNLYYLENNALGELVVAYANYKGAVVKNQKEATEFAIEQTKARLLILSQELEALAKPTLGGADLEAYVSKLAEVTAAQRSIKALNDLLASLDGAGSPGGIGGGGGGTSKTTDKIAEQNELFQEQRDILESNLEFMQRSGATIEEQVEMLHKMQDTVHQQAERFREQGLSEESEYLRELGSLWWEYYDQILEIQKENLDNELSLLDDKAWFIEQNLSEEEIMNQESLQQYTLLQNQRIEIFRQAQEKIHALAEVYRAQGLAEDSEQLRELGKLWVEYQNDIKDIYKDIEEENQRLWEESIQNSINQLEERAGVYEQLFSYMSNQIDKEIQALEEQRNAEESYWDEKINALEEQNEEIEEQIKLERLQEQLARARQGKVLVYKDGRFQYVQDVEEISEAEKNLEEYEREQALKQEVENLEKLKNQALASIDEQIKGWEKYKEEWSSVVDDYQEEQDRLLLEQELGIELEGENWRERLDNLAEYVEEYKSLLNQIADAQEALNNAQENISTGGIVSGGTAGSGGGGGGGTGPGGSLPSIWEDSDNLPGGAWVDSDGTVNYPEGHPGAEIDKDGNGRPDSDWLEENDAPSWVVENEKGREEGKYASGTLSAAGGLSLVGEQGPELRVLNQGDGIIPSAITKNLMDIGKYSLKELMKSNNVYNYMFDKLILPNVTDGNSFINEIKRFRQFAYQQ